MNIQVREGVKLVAGEAFKGNKSAEHRVQIFLEFKNNLNGYGVEGSAV